MTFTHLPQIANFIKNTHCLFAGTPWQDEFLPILSQMKADMDAFPAMTGATFEAMTDMSHGELKTLVTIERLSNGAWQYTEVVAE